MEKEDLLRDFSHEEEIHTPNRTWKFTVRDLANYRGMTTKLDEHIWLDWSDVLQKPEEARMHMYPSHSGDVPLRVRHMRIQTWQDAIVLFDDMMVDVEPPLTGTEIRELVKQQKIPRPQHVWLATDNPSLMKLLDSLGIKNEGPPQMYAPEWKTFAEIARKDGIVRPKRFLRNKAMDS